MAPTETVRAGLERLVRCYPGLHLRALARMADTSEALAGYHFDRLADSGRVRELPGPGFRRFFPAEPPTPGDRQARILAVLRRPIPFAIALHLLQAGPLSHGAIADRIDRAPSTATYHLATLQSAGIAARRSDGSFALVDPRQVERLLIRWPPPEALTRTCPDVWQSFLGGDAGASD